MINNRSNSFSSDSQDFSQSDNFRDPLIYKGDLTERMRNIFNEIDVQLITEQEQQFMQFLVSDQNFIKSLDSRKFVKINSKTVVNYVPQNAYAYTHDYYQKGNEIVIKCDKIFKLLTSATFRKAIYFKFDNHQILETKVILYIKRVFDDTQQSQLNNQLDFFNENADNQLMPRIYGQYIYKRDEEYLVSSVFQEKFGLDLYMQFQSIKNFSIFEKLDLANQLVSLVSQLHLNGRIHGDLKLENTVMQDRKIKLIDGDFYAHPDFSAIEENINREEEERLDFGTSINYPPELYFETQYDPYKVEIWYLGLIFYKIFSGDDRDLLNRPYQELSKYDDEELRQLPTEEKQKLKEVFRFVENITFAAKTSKGSMDSILTLIKSMLDLDPDKRPDIQQIALFLQNFNGDSPPAKSNIINF